MDHTKALDKIKKLLRLAASDNPTKLPPQCARLAP